MDSIKKFIAEQKSTDFMSVSLLCDALQEISERLDAHDRQLKEQDGWIKALEKVMASYEKKEYPVAQDERVCYHKDKCSNCAEEIGCTYKDYREKHKLHHLPCCDFKPKQAQDERGCDEYELPDLYHAGVIKPKAQDQGGKDKKVSGCFYDHESCDVVDDLRARLAEAEETVCKLIAEKASVEVERDKLIKERNKAQASNEEFAKGISDMAQALNFVKGICDKGGYEGVDKEKLYVPLRILGYVKKLEKENARLNCDINRMWSPEADLRARLAVAEANVSKMTNALATGKQITLVTEEYAAVVKERDDLRARLDDEKKRRVYYQGIVYDVMNSMSNGKGVCGTVAEPSTQVQDGVRLVLKHRNEFEQEAMNLRARLADAEKENKELLDSGVENILELKERLSVANADLALKEHAKDALRKERDEAIRQLEDMTCNAERERLAKEGLQTENAELKRSQCDLSKCKHIDDLEKECAVLKSGQCVSCGCLEKPNYKSEVKG